MLHITEEQVRRALPMAEAVELVEEGFRRLADGRMVNHPRRRVRLTNGSLLHAMEAGDNVSNLFGGKMYATGRGGARFVVTLFDAERSALLAVIDANALGQIRTGAASGRRHETSGPPRRERDGLDRRRLASRIATRGRGRCPAAFQGSRSQPDGPEAGGLRGEDGSAPGARNRPG